MLSLTLNTSYPIAISLNFYLEPVTANNQVRSPFFQDNILISLYTCKDFFVHKNAFP